MLRTNESGWDRGFRALIGIALIALLLASDLFSGGMAIVGWTLAAIMIGTALVGFCPLYRLFGISTCRVK